jgi:hypothetical protein
MASARVPTELAEATVRGAVRFASGQALTSGLVSTPVAVLAKQVLIGMVPAQSIMMSVMVVMMAALIVTGAGALVPIATDEPGTSRPGIVQAAPTTPRAPDREVPRTARPGTRPDDRGRTTDAGRSPSSEIPPPATVAEPPGVFATYRRLATAVGRNPDAQVRLALWCESHGLIPERLKHLSLAVLLDPGHATARGLLGLVAYRGQWQGTDAVAARVRADDELSAAMAEYNLRRRKTARTADAQWKLAVWCEQKGLKAEATAHLVAVTRIDPDHEGAWKRLGCKRYNGRWLTEDQVAAERAEAEAQKEANRRWKPLLTKWRVWLADRDRRDEAERLLAGVSDPYAAPAAWAIFAVGGAVDQARAVQLFGQIDAPAATKMLALLALFSPSSDVRRKAAETLSRRDPRDALALLIGLLRDPDLNPKMVLYRVQFLPTGAMGVGSPGMTFVEGRYANVLRFYTVDESRMLTASAVAIPRPNYERRVMIQQTTQVRELEMIVGALLARELREDGSIGASIRRFNARIIEVLRNIAGEDRGDDWEAWKRWWVEEMGYAYDPDQFRNPPDRSIDQPKPMFWSVSVLHTSCFGAGTPVRTLTGLRPIESIRPGDQVLSQDVETGALAFAPVLAVFHNKPAPTLRIDLDGEPIVATGIHRFWKAGRGWVMARELKPGDAVRTLGDQARVDAVSPDEVRPVFNLEVGESRSFFAGRTGALVHDNSQVQPVPHPFDAVADPPAPQGP